MTLEQIKQEVLKVPGTYEGESGNIRDNQKILIIGQRGNVSLTSWYKKALKIDIFKFSLNDLVYIQCLSEDLQKEFIQNLSEELQKEFIQIVWDFYGYSERLTIEEWKNKFEQRYPMYKFRIISNLLTVDYGDCNEYTADNNVLMLQEDGKYCVCDGANLLINCEVEDVEVEEKTDNEIIKYFDLDVDDFKDNVERLQYITDMKIRLCEEFEGIILGKCGCLLIEKLEVISETGTIYDNGELNLEQKLFGLSTVIGEGNIDTKERFNKLIELLDFVDKQYKERQEFLTTIK